MFQGLETTYDEQSIMPKSSLAFPGISWATTRPKTAKLNIHSCSQAVDFSGQIGPTVSLFEFPPDVFITNLRLRGSLCSYPEVHPLFAETSWSTVPLGRAGGLIVGALQE